MTQTPERSDAEREFHRNIEAHRKAARRGARSRLRRLDRDLVDDLAQEAIARVCESLRRDPQKRIHEGFTCTTAQRCALEFYRRANKRHAETEDHEEDRVDRLVAKASDPIVASWIDEGLENAPLSPEERRVLDLRRDGWTTRQIAEERRKSEDAVAAQWQRIKRKLNDSLDLASLRGVVTMDENRRHRASLADPDAPGTMESSGLTIRLDQHFVVVKPSGIASVSFLVLDRAFAPKQHPITQAIGILGAASKDSGPWLMSDAGDVRWTKEERGWRGSVDLMFVAHDRRGLDGGYRLAADQLAIELLPPDESEG